MNALLWAGQIFLAVAFLYSGIYKSIYSERELIARGQTGVVGLPLALIRFIGISEILGCIGIIAPWLTGIARILTPLTAVCFAIVMCLAAPIHYRLKEYRNVSINVSIFFISLFVALGRLLYL